MLRQHLFGVAVILFVLATVAFIVIFIRKEQDFKEKRWEDIIIGSYDNCGENDAGVFPWIATLVYSDTDAEECYGTLIWRRYVLTAAKCIYGKNLSHVDVKAVDCNPFKERCNPDSLSLSIRKTFIHPFYNETVPYQSNNDIGIIRISPVDHIYSICMPNNTLTNNLENGTILYSEHDANLQIEAKICGLSDDSETHICVTNEGEYMDNWIVGEPIMKNFNNTWTIEGIFSYRSTEFTFIKLRKYIDWIAETIKEDNKHSNVRR